MAGVQLSLTRVHSARLLIRDVPPNMRPSRSYSRGSTIQGDKSRRAAGLEGNGRGLVVPGNITQQHGRSLCIRDHQWELWLEVFDSQVLVLSVASRCCVQWSRINR